MGEQKRNFIIDELMEPDFIDREGNLIVLKELEESGESELEVHLKSAENLCIKNVDKKHTELNFFQKGSQKSMFKRVDHIIFEKLSQNNWDVHIIEMKSSVETAKWTDIKGKFRASYLLVQSIAAMLDLDIAEIYFYTTYERVDLRPPKEQPTARRLRVGVYQVPPQEEWDGGRFGLNFGDRIPFSHRPVPMSRDKNGALVGSYGGE